jgi:hypothetical protein
MNFSQVSTIVSLLFPPSFVISMYFFSFEVVAFVYAIVMFIYLVVVWYFSKTLKNVTTPLIYFLFVLTAYMVQSISFVKLIPALISASFFLFFLGAYIQKKEIILKMTKKFYNKLSEDQEAYIAKGDGYWAFVIFLNTLIQIFLVFYNNNEMWAFYSSVGWYIFLFIALILQIVYGQIYNTMRKQKEIE